MKVTIKTGRKEGFISSYNLFLDNGLRLKTEDLTFSTSEDRHHIRMAFVAFVEVLRAAGIEVEGEVS